MKQPKTMFYCTECGIEISRVNKSVDAIGHTEGEVVTEVADEETLGILTVCWHQDTRLRTYVYREECLRNTWEVDRYILHYKIRITRNDLLARNYLRLCHGKVEVWMVCMLTRCVHTISNMD